MPEKLKGGHFGIFQHPFCRKTKKKLKGDHLVSPGNVWYAEKKGNTFWFSSLGQMVQFDTIKFCRTFGRTILVTSGVSKKTLTESHDYS